MDGVATYAEELLVGYRWYDARGGDPGTPSVTASATPPSPSTDWRSWQSGTSSGPPWTCGTPEIGPARPSQVYVGYAGEVGEPPQQLKAFDAVRLEAGSRRASTLAISRDDLAVYDEAGGRMFPAGELTFSAGLSSRDIAATATVSPS